MGSQKMSDLENASDIIERFGGIRPMAGKMNIPVTTVQGWKKRNTIPENRVQDILKAAQEHNIDLSDIQNAANQNQGEAQGQAQAQATTQENHQKAGQDVSQNVSANQPKLEKNDTTPHDIIMAEIRNSTQKAIRTSIWVTTLLLFITLGAALFLFAPKMKQVDENAHQIQALHDEAQVLGEDIKDVNQRTSFMSKIVPQDLQAKMDNLQTQARNVQESVQQLTDQADTIQKTLFASDAGSLSARLKTLESQFSTFEAAPDMSGFVARVETLEKTVNGQVQLDTALQELSALVQKNTNGIDTLEQDLEQARQEQTALGQTLNEVSREDMKAAVTLLAFSQFRETLRREEPLAEDLDVLNRLAGDDPAFKEAINRLAPHAQDGVLTPEGLSEEFKGLAGDIVFASLKGEDVSLWDRTKARFSNALKVEKEGALVSGTDTQAVVSRAQTLLDQGDVKGAMAELNQLEGEAAQEAAPFMSQLQASVASGDMESMLYKMVVSNFGDQFGGLKVPSTAVPQNINPQEIVDTVTEGVGAQPEIIMDPDSNFKILPRQQSGFKGFKPE